MLSSRSRTQAAGDAMAAVANAPGLVEVQPPLRVEHRPIPEPGPEDVLLEVEACGVCHTDLHVVEGELVWRGRSVVPGHEIVGRVVGVGRDADPRLMGRRVGVGWLAWVDETCHQCRAGRENLCENARFTGYDVDGGYATHAVAHSGFVYPLHENYDAVSAAPLLCAGVVGFRALRLTGAGPGDRLGLYGYGASAHLVHQIAQRAGCTVLAFTRGESGRRLALDLGAVWAGSAEETHPPGGPLQQAIIFAPAGELIPQALQALDRGGTLVLGGIYMSPVPSMPYDLLWHERVVRSVANSTRQDARDLLSIAAEAPLRVQATARPLAEANAALDDVKHGRVTGAVVLVPPTAPARNPSH